MVPHLQSLVLEKIQKQILKKFDLCVKISLMSSLVKWTNAPCTVTGN